MKYSGIIYDDIANGIGIRTSLFVSGCRNNCSGCFNKEQQNFNYGEEFTDEIIDKILDSVDNDYHNGISILGGDPMEPENAIEVKKLVDKFRERFGKSKTIWLYTGYTFEDLFETHDIRHELLLSVDVVVDGLFIENLRDITLRFKGSNNQRIIDVNATKTEYKTVVIG